MAHAWKQYVCRQSGKEKKGGLKEKEPSCFLKIQIQSQTFPNLLENKFGERSFHLTSHPIETLPWPQGLRDLYPVNSVDLWREFHFMFSGKQENKLLWSFLKGVMKG